MMVRRLFILFVIISGYCFGQAESTQLKGPYLGQEPPGDKPVIFAPDIVCTDDEEFGSAFTPDGQEFYFTRSITDPKTKKRFMTVMVSRLKKNGWENPVMAPFCQEAFTEGEPNFSTDGKMVLFGRLSTTKEGAMDPRVMVSLRDGDKWSDPVDLMHGMMASITSDNMIYYTDITKGYAKGELYKVTYDQGHTHSPQKLGRTINSEHQDAHPYVTPDGNMLFFDSNRPGGYGDNDLYISFRRKDGSWGDAINMGPNVNSDKYDALPYLSYDGKYFFFSRNREIYWINAGFINDLKQKTFSKKINHDLNIESKIKTITQWYDAAHDPKKPGGYAVAIIKNGKVLLKKCYGYANEEHKALFTAKTVFDFASIAKQLTGFAVAKLIQMEKLSLRDDIKTFLPEIPDFGHKITIRHLLNHTSGLRDWVVLTKLSGRLPNDIITGKQIMKLIQNQKELNFIPGDQYAYSNTGYFLLANIISRIMKRPFNEWVKEIIFEPLQMNSSMILKDYDKIIPNRANSYELGSAGAYSRMTSNLSAIGSSSLLSTMDDMIKWLINLDTQKVGGQNLFDLMTRSSSLNNGRMVNYNFGLEKKERNGRFYYMHGGSWCGYSSVLVFFPDEHLSFIFFSNRSPSGVYLRHKVLNLILGQENMQTPQYNINSNRPFVKLDPKEYNKYLGHYALKLNKPESNRIYYISRVFIKDDRLVASSALYRNNRLFPVSKKNFFIKGDSNEYTFYTDKKGYCYQYEINHGDKKFTFLRMKKKVKNPDKAKELLGKYRSEELHTTYSLTMRNGELTLEHPVTPDAHIYKVGDGKKGYAGDTWWFNDVIFIRNRSKKVTGFLVQTTGGNRSTNIKFEKIASKDL